MADLAALTVGDFTPGDRFTAADGSVFELAEANALPQSPGAPREPFSLIFTGPAVAQGVYALEHPELGTLELFLVPVGPGRLEAAFG